jgi:small subunit ribosomal protein S21
VYNKVYEVGICIVKREGEDIESMIKRFKKKVNKSGILKDLKRKSQFDKPSIARRKKENEARRRLERDKKKESFKQKNIKGERNERDSSDK